MRISSPLFAALVLGQLSFAHAAELRTYRFLETAEQFRYFGGIIGNETLATLEGTFTISVDNEANASIAHFEVLLNEVLNTTTVTDVYPYGIAEFGWSDGDRLADRLWQDPSIFSGRLSQEAQQDSIRLSVTEPSKAGFNFLESTLSLEHSTSDFAWFHFRSFFVSGFITPSDSDSSPEQRVLFLPALDAPSMGVSGIPVQLVSVIEIVPEPAISTLLLSALATCFWIFRFERDAIA